jgi:hypothetical protein
MNEFEFLTLDEFQRQADARQTARKREHELRAKQTRQARAVQRRKLIVAFAAAIIGLIFKG